jgi:hypothetical protein
MKDTLTLEIIDPAALGGGLAVAIFFGILACLARGRWLGTRAIAKHGSVAGGANVGSLETAVFALLGLLIAFTFSGALERFDKRRAQVVDEANAVGTAYLRVDLLPPSAQPKVREAFKAYVDSRIATYRKLPDIEASRAEFTHSRELQGELWAQVVAALRQPDARPYAEMVVIPAMNEMINFTTLRVAATRIHPPWIIYLMLAVLAMAAALLSGYQQGGEKDVDWLHKIGFALTVAITVYVILDVEYPRLGFVQLNAIDQVLVDTRAGMK